MSRQQMRLGTATRQGTSYAGQATTTARAGGLYGSLEGLTATEFKLRLVEEQEPSGRVTMAPQRVWEARVEPGYVGLIPDTAGPEADDLALAYLSEVTPVEEIDAEIVVLHEIRPQW